MAWPYSAAEQRCFAQCCRDHLAGRSGLRAAPQVGTTLPPIEEDEEEDEEAAAEGDNPQPVDGERHGRSDGSGTVANARPCMLSASGQSRTPQTRPKTPQDVPEQPPDAPRRPNTLAQDASRSPKKAATTYNIGSPFRVFHHIFQLLIIFICPSHRYDYAL